MDTREGPGTRRGRSDESGSERRTERDARRDGTASVSSHAQLDGCDATTSTFRHPPGDARHIRYLSMEESGCRRGARRRGLPHLSPKGARARRSLRWREGGPSSNPTLPLALVTRPYSSLHPAPPLPPSKHRHTGLSGAARACHETSPHPRLSHPRCPPAPGGSTTRPGPPRPPPAAFAAAAARHHHGDRHGSGPVRRDSHRDCDRGNERRSRRRRRRPARRRRRRRPRPGSERALHPHEQLPLPARPDVPAVLFDPSHRNVCVRVICWSEDKRRRERGRA